MMRSTVSSTLMISAIFAVLSVQAAAVDRYNVVWSIPSTNHHGSMPIGNGDIGANAWFTPDGTLHLYLSKTDSWDDNGRILKIGKVSVRFEPNPFKGGSFRQTLNLAKGCIEIQTERAGQNRIRLFVDANNPVLHVAADGPTPFEATASIHLWRTNRQELAVLEASDVLFNRSKPNRKQAPTITEPDTLLSNHRNGIGWYHRNIKSVGPALMAEVQGLTGFKQEDPLLHRTFGAFITGPGVTRLDDARLRSPVSKSHRFDIFVLAQHPVTAEEWVSTMERTMTQIGKKSFARRARAHEQWWAQFWKRSWIHAKANPRFANGELAAEALGATRDTAAWISQMYHVQRYITACAGRGAYPIHFNGSIFTVPPGPEEQFPDYRRWGSGYWWQNTRLAYISLCASGDFDLQQPLFRMYANELLPLCKFRTRHYFGHEGAYYPECMMFWGAVFSEAYGWTPFEQREDKLQESGWHKWEWVSGLELCWMMLDYYDHTQDTGFLQRTVLPFTREILMFFDRHYPTNSQGKLVMHPSQSLETWWNCTNATPELAGCRAVAERVLKLTDRLAPQADRQLCSTLLSKLPPVPVREIDGKKALAPAEFFENKRNIENPELYPVFPFRLHAFNRPGLDLALTALEHRINRGFSGWRQDDIFLAYLGLTEEARAGLISRSRSHDPQERFPAFWGPNYDWTPDQTHGGVLMKTFQSMLLQTDGDEIFLFPAWPKDWDVGFKLHAPRKTIVEGHIKNGRVYFLKVSPRERKSDVKVVGHWKEQR